VCIAARSGHVFGPSLVEALSKGVPIVASNGPAHLDVIAHETNGLIFDQDSTAELAGAVQRILTEPATARRLSEAAKETACRLFVHKRFVENVEKLYAKMVHPS